MYYSRQQTRVRNQLRCCLFNGGDSLWSRGLCENNNLIRAERSNIWVVKFANKKPVPSASYWDYAIAHLLLLLRALKRRVCTFSCTPFACHGKPHSLFTYIFVKDACIFTHENMQISSHVRQKARHVILKDRAACR